MLIVRKPQEPAWTPVLGAQVLFAPIDRAMMMRARRAAREASQDLADQVDPVDLIDDLSTTVSRVLILEGALNWQGVRVLSDADDEGPGEELPFSRENLEMALADPVTFDAFEDAYVTPFALRERQQAEPGNASSASPSGTGEAAMPASDTATSPAEPTVVSDAAPAPTSSKNPSRRKKRTSGGS